MIPNIGGPELIILLVIVLLLFGAKKIPELARGLGTGMREFKSSSSGKYDEVESEKDDDKKNEDEVVLDRENDERKAEASSDNNSAGNGTAEPRAEDDATAEPGKAEQEQRR